MLDQPVFHRVYPTVPDTRPKRFFIADVMLPKSPLPQSTLAAADMACSARLQRNSLGKTRLNHAPPSREIGVAIRQSPYGMHVVRQHHPCVDAKRPLRSGHAHRFAQRSDLVNQCRCTSVSQRHGEEHRSAGSLGADVCGHGRILAAIWLTRGYQPPVSTLISRTSSAVRYPVTASPSSPCQAAIARRVPGPKVPSLRSVS